MEFEDVSWNHESIWNLDNEVASVEFEDVSQEVEWQARCLAAAFGVAEWERVNDEVLSYRKWFCGMNEQHRVRWNFGFENTAEVRVLDVSTGSFIGAHIWLKEDHFNVDTHQALPFQHEIMARGIHCLGLQDEQGFAQLDYSVTAHEKLELRLSLPREFWPQSWLDGEAP